jgi:hypothetical protein
MPDDLADMIYSRYTPQTAADVLANWHAIGEDGQALYRRYLDKAVTRRGRRERCSLAADQLYNPGRPLDIGDWGSSGG